MLETSLPMASNFQLATLPRVFLTPVAPGWVDGRGQLHLPLTMGGDTVDIGIPIHDDRALSEWVQTRRSFFASDLQEFQFYPTQSSYQEAVRPPWLSAAMQRIGHTVGFYASSHAASSRPGALAAHLSARWTAMQPLISALLYIQQDKNIPFFYLTPQDLCLYGPSLEDMNRLPDLIDLLSTVTHIDDLLREGMTDRIIVEDDDRGVRELHDVFGNTERPWLECMSAEGALVRLEKARIRPTCLYRQDDEGKIDPMATPSTPIAADFGAFHFEMVTRNAFMTGAYLMAHFRFDEDDLKGLESRIAPHVASSPSLPTFEELTIVAEHLRHTGRGQGRKTEDYADLIVNAVRKLLQTS